MERQRFPVLVPVPNENIFLNEAGEILPTNRYVKKLRKARLEPIIVMPKMSSEQKAELYATTSGILIPGGTDIEPWRYRKEPLQDKLMQPDPDADELQLDLVGRATKDQKPLLGICRGMQIMAVAHGGTLIQHLPDITDERHGLSVKADGAAKARAKYHAILIDQNTEYGQTLAYTIFNKTALRRVPSLHHQAIDDPGDLLITGRSPGGIAEVIEDPTLPFHIGVQFHPERSRLQKVTTIFKSFAEAIKLFEERPKSQDLLLPLTKELTQLHNNSSVVYAKNA